MKKDYFIAGIIAVVLIGLSVFSVGNRDSEFSTSTRGLPEAQSSQVVELKDGDTYDITASFVKKNINGNMVRMLAYNGSVPGPTIKVAQGATITLNYKNETDIANTIHSHGVRMKNEFDGVPDVTQKAVPVGGSFKYTLLFPDAGMYWYHPHVRDDYAVELGLYGNFWVTPKVGSSWNIVDREVPLFVDDIALQEGKIAPFYKDFSNHSLMGRYGNTMLVNGETNYVLTVKKGEVVRFYFTNSANVRPFNLAITGAKLKLVGGDNGLYERDEWKDSVVIAPSERVIVEVLFDKAGEYSLQNKTPDFTTTLGTIVVLSEQADSMAAKSFAILHSHPEVTQSIVSFRDSFSKPVDKRIKLSLSTMDGMQNMDMGHMTPDGATMGGMMMSEIPAGGIEWENSMHGNRNIPNTTNTAWSIIDQVTGKDDMGIDWKFKVGDKVKIRITNDGHSMHPMQHPIHFHGQRFLVLNRNGVVQTNLAWKDTVLVPAGQYVDILLDASNPGTWMAHCHILEHIEAGMMFTFKVE